MMFLEKFKDYAKKNNDFIIVNIGGSLADKNNKDRYDELSDIDIFIVTENKDYYLNNVKWLDFFNKKFIYFHDPISMGVGTELRVAFESGLLVDMAIVDSDEFKLLKSNKVFCEKILNRGIINIKNLVREEEDNTLSLFKENSIPLEYELNRKIDEFWIDMANIYKYLSSDAALYL